MLTQKAQNPQKHASLLSRVSAMPSVFSRMVARAKRRRGMKASVATTGGSPPKRSPKQSEVSFCVSL